MNKILHSLFLIIIFFYFASTTACTKTGFQSNYLNELLVAPTPTPLSGLQVSQLALLINDNDPYSVAVGEYYRTHRHVPSSNIIHLSIPVTIQLTRAQFAPIKTQVDALLGNNIQAIAIAWTLPSRVECNSMTSAISRGFMSGPCDAAGTNPTCGWATANPYYKSTSKTPFTDHGFRPSMMLAAQSLTDAYAMIDRGIASDGKNPTGKAHLMKTSDSTRSLRANIFPSNKLGTVISPYVDIKLTTSQDITGTSDTLFYFQGLASVSNIATNNFPPGAVADHLTSYGGMLTDSYQMSCLEFIAAGATGTFGTVSEPCAYSQKFPDPSIMISHYTSGESLIEAYWKSIDQTFQGEFVGEPLANPWQK